MFQYSNSNSTKRRRVFTFIVFTATQPSAHLRLEILASQRQCMFCGGYSRDRTFTLSHSYARRLGAGISLPSCTYPYRSSPVRPSPPSNPHGLVSVHRPARGVYFVLANRYLALFYVAAPTGVIHESAATAAVLWSGATFCADTPFLLTIMTRLRLKSNGFRGSRCSSVQSMIPGMIRELPFIWEKTSPF
ncbi:hypothetical protein EDB87DRAFT_252256 [Lactarius vividus]|nr:hypothetical protein EDB87DRAFT_252256 [Lactarius vividus]